MSTQGGCARRTPGLAGGARGMGRRSIRVCCGQHDLAGCSQLYRTSTHLSDFAKVPRTPTGPIFARTAPHSITFAPLRTPVPVQRSGHAFHRTTRFSFRPDRNPPPMSFRGARTRVDSLNSLHSYAETVASASSSHPLNPSFAPSHLRQRSLESASRAPSVYEAGGGSRRGTAPWILDQRVSRRPMLWARRALRATPVGSVPVGWVLTMHTPVLSSTQHGSDTTLDLQDPYSPSTPSFGSDESSRATRSFRANEYGALPSPATATSGTKDAARER